MPFWHRTDRFVLAPDAASSEAGMHHSLVEMKYDDDDDDLLDRDGEMGGRGWEGGMSHRDDRGH